LIVIDETDLPDGRRVQFWTGNAILSALLHGSLD
jgi:hypothetical protein